MYSPLCHLYLYDFFYSVEHMKRYFKKYVIVFEDILKNVPTIRPIVHTVKVNGVQNNNGPH